ncbi:MAG: hypothetical protein AB7G75_36490 [Candidatus Binatia bacterium]
MVIDRKNKSFYYCTNCEQQIATLARGVCPVCNSQAVVTQGWDRVPTQERADWFQRIHGGYRNGNPSPPLRDLQEEATKPQE